MASILLLEDDHAFSAVLSEFLECYGHIVDVVDNQPTAREHLLLNEYDLVIADIFLRVGGRYDPRGGLGLINWMRVKRHGDNRRIFNLPIVAISGLGGETTSQFTLSTASTLGADRVFPKPVPSEDLLEAIDTLTARRETVPVSA